MGARTYTGPNSFYFFEKFLLDELTRLNISPSWGQKPFSDSGRTAPPVLSNTRRMFPCFKSTLTRPPPLMEPQPEPGRLILPKEASMNEIKINLSKVNVYEERFVNNNNLNFISINTLILFKFYHLCKSFLEEMNQ